MQILRSLGSVLMMLAVPRVAFLIGTAAVVIVSLLALSGPWEFVANLR